jgi:hypothetical protein
MKHLITGMRPLAIIAGCAFTAGGLFLLLGEVARTPSAWTTYHWLTILTVFGTVCAGHLVGSAWRDGRYLAVVGFSVIFTAGTLLVVYQSVGRQAETTGTKVNSAEQLNKLIASKFGELDITKSALADAQLRVSDEMAGRGLSKKPGCKSICQDWQKRANDLQATVTKLETEITKLGAPVPVAPDAEYMASFASVFGADFEKAKAALQLMKPFLLTFFFEIGIVASFGHGFQHRARSDPRALVETPPDSPEVVSPSNPVKNPSGLRGSDRPSGGGSPVNPRLPPPDRPEGRREEVLAALLTDLAIGRKFPSQRTICETHNVKRSTLSDWLRTWEEEELIPARVKTGRCKSLVGA